MDSTCNLVASPSFMTMPSPYFLFKLASVVSSALPRPISLGAATISGLPLGAATVILLCHDVPTCWCV